MTFMIQHSSIYDKISIVFKTERSSFNMDKQTKIGLLEALLILGLSLFAFPQGMPPGGIPSVVDLRFAQRGLADFSSTNARTLPFSASLGLNWSDAYIGKFFPGAPPHFGAGLTVGFTTMKVSDLKSMSGSLGNSNIPFDMARLPLPAYTVEGRIGGFFLPFDIGIKIGYLPLSGMGSSDMELDNFLAGGDIRYAVLDNAVLPKISVGVGLNYLEGGFGVRAGGRPTYHYEDGSPGGVNIMFRAPRINMDWSTLSLDFKAQISKSFLIFTPYFGVGAGYAWSSVGYSIEGKPEAYLGVGGPPPPSTTINMDALNAYLTGLNKVKVDDNGMSSTANDGAFSIRAFGGVAFNLGSLRLDLTGLYNFPDSNFGFTLGFRFQM
jgi:hypothetical protein